jgi:ferredoxin
MTTTLIRSKDRKVANRVSPSGKASTIANTFGLPSGKEFSCPGATSVCETICYAGKLEKIFKGVREVLVHNFDLLRNTDKDGMVAMLDEMITAFEAECDKKNAEKLFRIHWDGDFFNQEYAVAWREVIERHADTQFWVYTRSVFAVYELVGVKNLGLYFSTDSENYATASALAKETGVKLAYLANTFEEGKNGMRQITGKTGVPCPENNRKLPMISEKGSACVTCGQCIFARNDILFSATKK